LRDEAPSNTKHTCLTEQLNDYGHHEKPKVVLQPS